MGTARVTTWRGAAAVVLASGPLQATFLPEVGLVGASLRHRGDELLVLPKGLAGYRAGSQAGLPLLAPWANRLGGRRYRVGETRVDLADVELHTDGGGFPIHGTMTAHAGWTVELVEPGRLRAAFDTADHPDQLAAFPFPHALTVDATLTDHALSVATTLRPTGEVAVPVCFGWHPYLRLPGTPRRAWTLALPDRTHLLLDRQGLPTGGTVREPAETGPMGTRTFDDLYRLDGDDAPVLSLSTPARSIDLTLVEGYHHAQVFVPPGAGYACLEPMVAATDALVAGGAPLVAPGEAYRARFTLSVTEEA